MACKDCPFRIENILKFKTEIYDEVKEKNRDRAHRCHKKNNRKLCEGFIQEAFDRDDRKTLVIAFEEGDFIESGFIKNKIKELDLKHNRDTNG